MNYTPYLVPVSSKGIVFENGKVWLRKNERDEWELPGGKIDAGEQPEETVARELLEELGFEVKVNSIIDAHIYTVQRSIDESNGVLVMCYACELLSRPGTPELVGEAGQSTFKAFAISEIAALTMPDLYKRAIEKAYS